jgi:hypothetical protein
MSKVNVLLFAAARQAIGRNAIELDLPYTSHLPASNRVSKLCVALYTTPLEFSAWGTGKQSSRINRVFNADEFSPIFCRAR